MDGGSLSGAGEDAALVVDNAMRCVDADAAAAEWVGGGRLMAHQCASQRVLDVRAADLSDKFAENGVEPLVDRFFGGVRPFENEMILVELETT